MAYLYHRVPENMKGKTLYPLNQLKTKHPKVYRENIEKYKHRKYVLNKEIPPLDCKWPDVIHLVSVHPSKISKALKESRKDIGKCRWYKIPASFLQQEKSAIYLFKYKEDLSNFTSKDQFTQFRTSKVNKYKKVPELTKKHYEQEIKAGREPLSFMFIPHVFYKGKIDVSNCEVIEA